MRESSPYALVFNGRSSPALKCPATTRPGPRRRNVFLSRTLPNYFGFHESAGIRLRPRIHVVVLYLHSVARGGGKPFASPSPGKSSHCTHALLFRTTMTAFPRNGHVLYKDLPTPYQLSGNNSWGSFLQSKTVWDRKIEAPLFYLVCWAKTLKCSSGSEN